MKTFDARRDKIKRNLQFRFPAHIFSFAADIGTETFNYYQSDNQPMPTLTKHDPDLRTHGGGAVLYTYVNPANGFTFETAGSVSYAWKASDSALKLCTPAGSAGMATGQVCEDDILGGPTGSINSQARALLGFVDTKSAFWRISAGFFYDQTTAPDKLRIGGIIPAYVDLANLKKQNSAIYSGVIRISPGVAALRDKGIWKPQVFVVIDILGERTLFNRASDYL